MSPEGKAICFFIAMVFFIIEAFGPYYRGADARWPHLGWLGLAAFALPFFWDAVKST